MVEYCRFEKNGIDDFRGVILPNVWEQLLLTDDFQAQGLRLIGALDGDEPVAALVARFLEQEEVYVSSLYVRADHRHQGIGTYLIRALCEMAADAYPHTGSEDFPLFVHTEYALPTEDCAAFEIFLRKQGFTDFLEKNPTYLFEREDIKRAADKVTQISPAVKNLTQLPTYDFDLFADVFEAAGFTADPSLCFFHQGEEEPDFMAGVTPGEDSDLYLCSTRADEEVAVQGCEEAVAALLKTLCTSLRGFNLIVDGETNVSLPLWEQLAQDGGTVCRRQEAGMYVVFDA